MNDLMKIKGGSGKTPSLQDRELGYNKSEKALYIGTEGGNVRLCGAEDKDVFYAIFGVTTGEEVNAAYKAGKVVACKLDNGRVLYLVTDWGTEKGFTFSSTDYLSVMSAEVDGSAWAGPTYQEFATKEYIDSLLENKEGEANG